MKCPSAIKVSLKKEVLKEYPKLPGVYEISSTVNGKSTWKKNPHAIWYNSSGDSLFVGSSDWIGDNTGYIVSNAYERMYWNGSFWTYTLLVNIL